jgi:hypothetical protein
MRRGTLVEPWRPMTHSSSLGPSFFLRAATFASFLAIGLAAACGGKALGKPGGTAPGDDESGSGTGSGSSGDDSSCPSSLVSYDAGSYDQSCNQDSDCVFEMSVTNCQGNCYCSGVSINVSAQASYESSLPTTSPGDGGDVICSCPEFGSPVCHNHQCGLCLPGPDGKCINTADAGSPPADGGSGGGDAGQCVNIDLSTYDQSCKSASDCVGINSGEVCSGTCECGGALVNKSEEARYDKAVSGIDFAECPCPALGVPACISGRCTFCGLGGSSPGCPDGG